MATCSANDSLLKFCNCVFEVMDTCSSISELPKCCKDFIDTCYVSFGEINQRFDAAAYLSLSLYIDELFNKQINTDIRDKNVSTLRFDTDSLYDMTLFMEEYCKANQICDFPKTILEDICSLILQRFRSFKNMVLYSQNVANKQSRAHVASMTRIVESRQNELLKQIDTRFKDTQQAVDVLESELAAREKDAHDHSITILGVFSAIVLVFNAAVSFFTSAFGAFSNASIYKILTILLIIGVIFVGAMMGLFFYLDRIRPSDKFEFLKNKKEKQSSSEMIYVVDKAESGVRILKLLLPFLITLVILIIMLLIVLYSWEVGLVEARNQSLFAQESKTDSETGFETDSETDVVTSIQEELSQPEDESEETTSAIAE
ncbi:MAG: stage II sporulation protein M [Ruminococcaceae bacterium]|nr:stage II sporulation protein M [Oscillospiraceae bacterium]